jgi:hypothetical protein
MRVYSGITQLVPKPQKCAKRRQKAQKGDFMAEKGAHMAVKLRILASLTPFGELGKNIVFCNYFLIFFLFLLKV